MTRFIHDQFAKQYLSELLSSFGTVETIKDIASEVRQVDVYFTPIHRKKVINKLAMEAGREVMFLPTYSLHLTPFYNR